MPDSPLVLTIQREGEDNIVIVESPSMGPGRSTFPRTRAPVEDTLMREISAQMVRFALSYATRRNTESARPSLQNSDDALRELQELGGVIYSQMLTEPAREQLARAESGFLHLRIQEQLLYVPWELAYTGEDFLANKFWLGRQVLSEYQPARGRRERPKTESLRVLVIGDPTEDLPEAMAEAEEVWQLLRQITGIQATFLSGKKSVRKTTLLAKLSGYDVVHFAGHSFYQPADPTKSGWRLVDGTLTAGELSRLPYAPHLVFSNSCEAGETAGERSPPSSTTEGQTTGLGSAFLDAGVQNYIGTLWKVDDTESRELATAFYRSLVAGCSSGEALCLARHHSGTKTGSKLTWASYVLYGDPAFQLMPPSRGEGKGESFPPSEFSSRQPERDSADSPSIKDPLKVSMALLLASLMVIIVAVAYWFPALSPYNSAPNSSEIALPPVQALPRDPNGGSSFTLFSSDLHRSFETTLSQGQQVVLILDGGGRQVGTYTESHALVVGISNYTGGWPPLPGVKEDVTAVTQALEMHGFHVVVVQDPNAVELEGAYRDFIKKYGLAPDNRLLFYYAGSGHTIKPAYALNNQEDWMGYLVGRDAPLLATDLEGFRRHSLSMERFASMSLEIQAKHTLFVFDACFSGAITFALGTSLPEKTNDEITQQTIAPVRQFISAGTADQQVPDYSFFRRFFVKALEGDSKADRNGDGYLTGSELGKFLQDQVPVYFPHQTPQYGKMSDSRLDRGEFVLIPPLASLSSADPPTLPLPDKPSIAVLPFTNVSEDPEQDYFSDGMTETLITDLSKVSGLFVIARNSTFTYKGKSVSPAQLSRELRVRYLLKGSVQKADERVRINTQLIDATTGEHIWTERYDRELTDIFTLQDEITQQIVVALGGKVTAVELERIRRIPTENLTAYEAFLRGSAYYWRLEKAANARARELFEQAIALDPQYADAYVLLGWTYYLDWVYLWNRDAQTLEQALEWGQRALTLDNSLIYAHMLLGWVYLHKQQYEQALRSGERALALNPNQSQGHWVLGQILNRVGRPQEAIGLLEQALRLDPYSPFFYLPVLGEAYYLVGRYEEAVAVFKRTILFNPNYLQARLGLTATYSRLGQDEEARGEAAEVLRISPNFSLETFRQAFSYKDPAQTEQLLAVLRQAGLE